MGVAGGHHLAQVVRVPTGLEDGADGAGSSSGAPDVGTAAVPGAALTAAGAHVGHVGGMVAGDEVVEADAVRLVAGMTQQHPVWEEAEVMLPNPPVGGHTRTVEPLRQAKRPYPSSPRAPSHQAQPGPRSTLASNRRRSAHQPRHVHTRLDLS